MKNSVFPQRQLPPETTSSSKPCTSSFTRSGTDIFPAATSASIVESGTFTVSTSSPMLSALAS
ncbi:hypothetical protein D3C83_231170 [compost metagenome]